MKLKKEMGVERIQEKANWPSTQSYRPVVSNGEALSNPFPDHSPLIESGTRPFVSMVDSKNATFKLSLEISKQSFTPTLP